MAAGRPARPPAPPLQVLRQELQPLAVQQQVLHSLAALLLRSPRSSAPPSPAARGAASPGSGGGSGATAAGLLAPAQPPAPEEQLEEGREALLEQLQDSLLPSLLIPERRLEELVEQALLSQVDRCPYDAFLPPSLSLFSDYQVWLGASGAAGRAGSWS